MKKIIFVFPIFLLIISIFPRCAKIVAPTGGPKDTLAPVLVRSVPLKNSLNYKGEKLILTFNEYIQIKDVQKKLAISPPMLKKPELLQRGKNLEVRFNEPLKENTTYTFYFADAIVDNNELNAIKSFEFAFSTGNIIDSLTVSGRIINSFTLLPEADIFVMLYENLGDSVPIKELPRYLTRTNKNGFFIFKNLQYNDFKVFALKDNNSNYKFDQVSEDIAFQDELVKKEALKGPSLIDTSRLSKKEINLFMFKENSRIQARTGFSRTQRHKLALAFTKKPEGSVSLTPLNFKTDNEWFVKEINQSKDSLIYWITDDQVKAIDTLKIQVSYLKTDSLLQLQLKFDTLKFIFTDKVVPGRSRKEIIKEVNKKISLSVASSIKTAPIAKPTKPVEFVFPMPLKKVDETLITITNLKDSTKLEKIKLVKDSLNPRLYRFNHAWESEKIYKLEILPDAFISLDGVGNDTIKATFKGANPENFGVLIITLLGVKKAAIVELLNEKRTQVINHIIAKPQEKITLNFIDPGKYTLRFIDDSNFNGEWDTGWYLKGLQPERVVNYDEGKTKGVINIRANWESEIQFDFSK